MKGRSTPDRKCCDFSNKGWSAGIQAQCSWLFCRLVLPANLRQKPKLAAQKLQAGASMQQQPAGTDGRSLLATTTSASSLNPTLECDGCPDTDTRVRVNDTTQFPWTAVGMVTRDQQGAISRSACFSYVASVTHVLPRACFVLSNQ